MEQQATKNPWVELTRQAYSESTTFIDNNYRTKWEDSIAHFRGEHSSDSKFNKASYRYRSKIFRPKTRASIRNNEAAAVAAFFANQDVISMEAQDQNSVEQVAAARLMEEVLNYRLTTTIPWFQICLGGIQDAQVIGVVASYQYWDYEEEVETVTETYEDAYGIETELERDNLNVLSDKPCVELIPIENLRIHPSADWVNPITSSPYVMRLVPMYVYEVLERMEKDNPKTGMPKWKKYTKDQIRQSQKYLFDSTRLSRSDSEDKFYTSAYDPQFQGTTGVSGSDQPMQDFDTIWCIENFMQRDGEDHVYWTLGTEFLLSDPKPLEEVYWHGERPIVMGFAVLQAHELFPGGVSALASPLQKELNEVINQRLDNVKLAMNKRYIGRRGANIDYESLLRNVAGSITLADDVAGDIRELEFSDVTGSSYMEQDRLNLDYDELVGTFSPSTVQSNRKMNETVRGMAMIMGGANQMTEFMLRTISETWIEPVMRQLVKLEQMYETDDVILALAADRAQLWQRYGIDEVTDSLLKQHLTVRVNVGMGATDPMMKLQNFMQGINAFATVLKEVPPGVLNMEEVGKEIFGRMGYKDGTRFMVNQEQQDPEKVQMAQALQQAQQIMQDLQRQVQDKGADRQVKLLDTQMRESGQDRRTAAELQTRLVEKKMDLMNPVAGEKRPYGRG